MAHHDKVKTYSIIIYNPSGRGEAVTLHPADLLDVTRHPVVAASKVSIVTSSSCCHLQHSSKTVTVLYKIPIK